MLRHRIQKRFAHARHTSFPGWQRAQRSSGSAKTQQEKDADRQRRQIEKLPSPVALPDLQYPLHKHVLSDQHFQRPVYDNHLDTPELFNLTPPDEFFVHWNIRDFGRTAYPPVPEIDHRLLRPGAQGWDEHRDIVQAYLLKHGLVPDLFPRCPCSHNLTVTFGGETLTRRNFWFTSHCGNYMELKECQTAPRIRIARPEGERPDALYTVILASPDYPSRAKPNAGFFLHYVVSNVAATDGAAPATGDTLVPYVPPLPTEDAGTARVLCILLPQTERLPATPLPVPFELRSNFRLHDTTRAAEELKAFDAALDPIPRAISFFQTNWDIQVQEWYEKQGVAEPTYVPDDIENILGVVSQPKAWFQPKTRTNPDGSFNRWGTETTKPYGETALDREHMTPFLSRRTMLSKDGKTYVQPQH
jgi:hypothetical protein